MHTLQQLDSIVGAGRTALRAYEVLGAAPVAATSAGPSRIGQFLQGVRQYEAIDVKDGLGTLVGALAGLYLGKRRGHEYLGVLAGASLGRNLPALMDPSLRGVAARNLLTTGGGVAGSLFLKKHPVAGYAAGLVVGGIASHYVVK